MIKHLIFLLLTAATVTIVSSCASADKVDYTTNIPANELYSKAKYELTHGDYEASIINYQKLEANYPSHEYSRRAQLEMAFAYWKSGEPEAAIMTLDRFLRIHPGSEDIDYALYLRGIASLREDRDGLFVFPKDPSQRDQRVLKLAFDAFERVVKEHPDSRYAPKSHKKLKQIRNYLAQHELHVAEYYYAREAYLAAVNRAKEVIEKYQGSTAVPDALVMMVKAYRKLDIDNLAEDSLAVLKLNYPEKAVGL